MSRSGSRSGASRARWCVISARACGGLVEERLEQRLRVLVPGVGEDVGDGAGLDELPAPHHRDPVAEVGDDAEVVRHDQDRHLALALEVAQQIEHLGLDGDVERRRRLVGDDQVGLG